MHIQSLNINKFVRIILVLFFGCICSSYSQTNENIVISLKDFHSAKITDATFTSDDSHFISSDASGKILMYNTKDYSYTKTIRKASGIPIQKLRLIVSDSILVFQQKYEFSDGTTDSIFGIHLFDNKTVFQNQLSGNFIGNQDNAMIACSKNSRLYILEVFNKRFQPITKAFSTKNVKIAALSYSQFSVAYVEDSYGIQNNLVLVNTKTGKDEIVVAVPENLHVLHVFFDKDTDDLNALVVDGQKNKFTIYNLSKLPEFKSPIWETTYNSGKFATVNTRYKDDSYIMVITSTLNFPDNPLVITYKSNMFSSYKPDIKDGSNLGLPLKTKDDILLFKPFFSNLSSVVGFSIYDIASKKVINSFPKGSRKFYSGTFLPKNNWMIVGRELNTKSIITHYEPKIKFYESGTFNNRYGKLDYSNYLEATHKIKELPSSTFMFDKRNGIHPFYGYKIAAENEYAFYKYDLINNSVSKIADEQPKYRKILDYNNLQNYLLISAKVYYNHGHTEPQEFVLVKNNNISTLKGSYKFGKISNSGTYILTIDANNKAEIRTTNNLKVVFEKQLNDGSYKLFNLDDNAFAISNSFNTIGFNTCNKESIIIDFDKENNSFKSSNSDCVIINDITYSKGKIAMIFEGIGVFLNNEQLQFLPSEFPESISFNDEATKLMVSFNNGKISIYDTTTLKEVGVMLHPDEKSHVFIDSEGYFFSNVNPYDYIIATKDQKPISITEIEKDYFNPEKVLSVFGTPNQQYVKALEKAINIKAKTILVANNETKKSIESLEDSEPDLYVLSIGVSEYKQSDFNLTFADKDALDIAKIYGKLDNEVLENYNTKFYGKVYSLYDNTKTAKTSMNKYSEQFGNIGDLQALNSDGSIWLESKYGDFFIWDFNTGKTEPIILPSDFSSDSYTLEKVVFINPDNSGFYIKIKSNKFYSYTFSSKKFEKVKIPFPDVSSETIAPISDQRWIHFSDIYNGSFNEASLSIGKTNSETIKKTIKFNLDIYTTLTEESKKTIDTSYISNPILKAISSNGKHLIYHSFAFENDVFYKDLSNDKSLPVKLNINQNTGYSSYIYIAEDGLTFSIVSLYSDDFKYEINTYSISGKLQNTTTLIDDDNLSLKGFTCFNNNPKWIKQSESLVSEEFFDANKLLSQNNPYSFKNTFVKHLTNKNANSNTIKEELVTFLKNTKSNDQVIVFLAGHGVLDEDLNYYFAPYDMDFNNVTANGVSLNSIIESLKQSRSENKLLLMDSCHSGNTLDMEKSEVVIVDDSKDPNKRGSKAKSTNPRSKFKVSDIVSTLFEDFLSTSGITIISASAGEDVAYENKELGNGAFTSAYINLLKNELKGNGYIIDESNLDKSIDLTEDNIAELLKEVMILTNGKQVPDLREVNKNSKLKMW